MTPKELKDAMRVMVRYLERQKLDPETGRSVYDPPLSDLELEIALEMNGVLDIFNAFPDRVHPPLTGSDRQWLFRQVLKVKKMESKKLQQKALIKTA